MACFVADMFRKKGRSDQSGVPLVDRQQFDTCWLVITRGTQVRQNQASIGYCIVHLFVLEGCFAWVTT